MEVDEETLSADELKERRIMKLLLKIKNGTPPMRKVSFVHAEWHLGNQPTCEVEDRSSAFPESEIGFLAFLIRLMNLC